MRFLAQILLAPVLALAVLTGCAQVDKAITTAEQHPAATMAAQLAVQYGTLKFIAAAEDPAGRAARVVEVTSSAAALVQGDAVTALDGLEQAVRDQIDWARLKPEDAMLVNGVIGMVRLQLAQIMTEHELGDPARKVAIVTVLGWVESAAALRAGSPSPPQPAGTPA